MTYDDRPYYEQNKSATDDVVELKKSGVPWFSPGSLRRSAAMVSPILSWYQANDAKRSKGHLNEIDLNEIAHSLKGVKNRWFDRVMQDRPAYKKFVDNPTNENWDALLHNKPPEG